MMNNLIKKGIYIHIPFCMHKCIYCDFLSSPQTEDIKTTYVQTLQNEIRLTSEKMIKEGKSIQISSIFFGGGTPSILDAKHIKNIMNCIRNCFEVLENAEITIECNPGTVDEEKFDIYRESGINRISFGLQSCDNGELKMLGRIHTFEQFLDSYRIAEKCGFNNINVDLMSAIPGQSVEGYINSLKKVIELSPKHISAYSLILEEGTYLFDNLKKYPPVPTEEDERDMYYQTKKLLESEGYNHYEISNFAREGFECRHNLTYWERGDYLGFGIGAASLFEGVRYSNTRDLNKYIELNADIDRIREDVEKLGKEDEMAEFMFLGLRKIQGISIIDFEETFGESIFDVYGREIEKNINKGLLKKSGSRIMLTPRGIDISNTVMSDFII